mgnify:FL=1
MKIIVRILLAVALLAGLTASCVYLIAGDPEPVPSEEAGPASRPAYDKPVKMADARDPRIDESSGVAAVRRAAGLLCTFKVFGDRPRLFALDRSGRLRATLTLDRAANRDWEDMAAFTWDGEPWLLVADTGDNDRRHEVTRIYLLPEPEIPAREDPDGEEGEEGDEPDSAAELHARPAVTVEVRYPDGAQDVEAVGVDSASGTAYFVSKRGGSRVYALELPPESPPEPVTLERVAELDIIWPTGMDFSPDGRRAVILTYGGCFEYARGEEESWADAFAREPRDLPAPRLWQREAVCYAADGCSLYVTSEGSPCPLYLVPARAEEAEDDGE